MIKVLITGSNGQLGNELKELADSYALFEFIFTDLPELDITSETAVSQFFKIHNPDVILNCAAYTAVDKAEQEEELAFRVNALAPGILASAAADIGAFLVHISTDYVYDGLNFQPYTESDKINPLSVYARSKAAGEKAVIESNAKAIIIRTSWLYSAFGTNFVKTILKYGIERESLNVVFDQTGTPTYARDLAQVILETLPMAMLADQVEIYHYSNEGVASWYDFAKAILDMGAIDCKLFPIPAREYALPAPRPFYTVLDKSKIKKKFAVGIPYWRDSLQHCLRRLI